MQVDSNPLVVVLSVGNSSTACLAQAGGNIFTPARSLPTHAWQGRTLTVWRRLLRDPRLAGPVDNFEVVLGGVVPQVLAHLEQFLLEQGVLRVWRFRSNLPCPLKIVPRPARAVGDDRLAAALAALSLDGTRPWVVIDAGTALTVNTVRPLKRKYAGVFMGGLIVPGELLALRALSNGTALLPDLAPWPNQRALMIGRSTQAAMRAGVRQAQIASAIELAVRQARRLGPHVRVALTGGGAPYLWPEFRRRLRRFKPVLDEQLVTQGLLCAWNHQHRKKRKRTA